MLSCLVHTWASCDHEWFTTPADQDASKSTVKKYQYLGQSSIGIPAEKASSASSYIAS